MSLPTTRVAIIGGGLSGLYAAYLLEQQGMPDYVLLEARPMLGGRIQSVAPDVPPSGVAQHERFDLGPSWYWPAFQRQMDRLLDELGLARLEQFDAGDMLIERSASGPLMRSPGYQTSPPSVRLQGGMAALVEALRERLDPARVITGQRVNRLRRVDASVEVESFDSFGRSTCWRAEQVLLALPPRLAESSIAFSPALPPNLTQQWQATATWMAPHAKYVAIYERPFWREQGLSGEARSMRGPLGEIHDASIPGGRAALFGFFGMPLSLRQTLSEELLRQHCRAQLERLFGQPAAAPVAELIKDWAQEPFTATRADQHSAAQHAMAPMPAPESGPWAGCLTGIGSEWSAQFPGYLAGAIEAASLGVQGLFLRAHGAHG